jgi:hypothetical protein
MSFNGWLSFAGNEIINDERTLAYAKELLPGIRFPVRCSTDEKGLSLMLDDPPYSMPQFDDAPWIDHDDPDTYRFAGALSLGVSGLTDSTRTAEVVQNSADGGSVAGRRMATKEVRVTALLLAADEAALAAGKRWLSAALTGGCDPCEPADLCFLTGTSMGEQAFGDYVKSTIYPTALVGSYPYNTNGTFKPTTTAQEVRTPQAPRPLPCDEIFWHWRISSASVGTVITLETLGETGVTNTLVHAVPTTGGTFTISDRGQSERKSWSRLRVTSAPNETVVIDSVDIEFRQDPPDDACFQKYARQLRAVTCIAGPTTIEEYEPSTGAMERVEFSFSADVPHVYGLPREVVSVLGTQITKNMHDSEAYLLTKMMPVCTVPKQPALIMDPDCPAVPLPPRSNVSVSSCAADPDYYKSYALAIPDSAIPLWSEAVPIMTIRTDAKAARKVLVRFVPRPFDSQIASDLDPCSACGEFVIDYIPPYSTFTLNGMEERAYITQKGNKVTDAGHLLSGMTTTTLFQWPVLTCGTGYLAVVDIANTGVTEFGVSIATRES